MLQVPVLTDLVIRHTTIYNYHQPVNLGPHRLMLRPRESRELRLLDFDLRLSLAADLHWSQDVLGNGVATATFDGQTRQLEVVATSRIALEAMAWPVFDIAAFATRYPFRYPDDDWTDLGNLSRSQYDDPRSELHDWALSYVCGQSTDTLSLLRDLSAGVSANIHYQARDIEGTQSPLETLDLAQGSCRDLTVLFVEAARTLGFGARLVSGYLHNPNQNLMGSSAAGSTHAWAEVFVPGAGWITFDPTNQSMGGANLIPVAVARHIKQTVPVEGSFIGMNDAFRDMQVEVSVTQISSPSPNPSPE